MSDPPPSLPRWRLVPASESLLDQIVEMERVSYPADEMCTADNFQYRLKHAGPFFKVAVEEQGEGEPAQQPSGSMGPSAATAPRVLGFVVGTLSASSTLHHDSMFGHDPHGAYLCIHSVVTHPALRRRGLARAMLREYVERVKGENGSAAAGAATPLRAMVLIAKEQLVPFYQSCGFALQGRSDVEHGAEQWFECRMKMQPLLGPMLMQQQQPEREAAAAAQ